MDEFDALDVPPEPAPLPRWPTVVAWCVILACVALMVVSGLRPHDTDPHVLTRERADGPPATEFVMQARLAVGAHHLGGGPLAPQFLAALEQAATLPADRLRVVPVAAEIDGNAKGSDPTLSRLDELAAEHLPELIKKDVGSLRAIYQDGPVAIGPKERSDLLARHGWFAQLALAHGLPSDHADRRAALAPAVRAARAAAALLVGGGFAFATGFILLVLALVRYLDGRLRFAYAPPPPGRSGPFVEAFAVYLVGMVVVSSVVAALAGGRSPLWANFFIALAVPPALLWPRLRGLSWPEVRAGFGLHRGRGLLREAAWGVGGYVAGLPLLAVAFVVTSILINVSGNVPTHPIAEEAGAGIDVVRALQLYALAAAYAPVVEELMFRGAFYHHVRSRLPWWLAAAVVAVLFAAIHPQGWVGIPVLATIAFVLAALREWRGSIVAPIVAHACVNGVTVTLLVMMAG